MPWVHIAIIILLIIVAIVASSTFKVQQVEFQKTGKHPKGYYMGIGIGIGLSVGIPIGIAMGNITLGPAVGLLIGVIIGIFLEKKYANKLRPFTEQEEKMQYNLIAFLTGALLLGLVAFLVAIFF